ncbi:MAG: acetyl-CoA hydrolase [Acidimicrobiia bacterium]|nr:acetyl-CoA hydrolase [Acidimicrobiia bacterium]
MGQEARTGEPGGRDGRRVAAQEAIAAVGNGDRVFFSGTCATPTTLLDELVAQRHRFDRLDLVCGYLVEPPAFLDHAAEPFYLTATQATPAMRAAAERGALRVLPARYSDYVALLAPDGPLPVDVALLHVSEPGPDGRFSLGVATGTAWHVAAQARLVIAQVNPRMPYCFGDAEVGRDAFDLLVDVDEPLVELHSPRAGATLAAVASAAADLVPDGATLQFGIGALPDAVLTALGDRRHLGIHSGMFSQACVDLVEGGAVTNTRKGVDVGISVAAEVIGDQALFDWVHRNPRCHLVRAEESHGAASLARLARFTAINGAIEVALDGSLNSEVIAGKVVSGPGGLPDFAFAASLCAAGRSIIALPSVAGRSGTSRIVARIEPPAPVTLPAYLADRVVTEYGTAELRGLDLAEREVALRGIAHPDHRDALAAFTTRQT